MQKNECLVGRNMRDERTIKMLAKRKRNNDVPV